MAQRWGPPDIPHSASSNRDAYPLHDLGSDISVNTAEQGEGSEDEDLDHFPINIDTDAAPLTGSGDSPCLTARDKAHFISSSKVLSVSVSPGLPLRRFYLRGAAAILVPTLVTAYFVFIWRFYLGQPSPAHVSYAGARFVYFSWFFIGTVGLNLAKYGLIGVEAGMLMEPAWSADNAMQTIMHCEHSWSGPSGWMGLAKQAFFWKTKENRHPQWPSKTWFVLATLSATVFLALPISGLSMELSDGYVTSNQHPLVMGSTFDNFNLRMNEVPISRATSLWKASVAPRAPQLGIIYTSPNQSHARDELLYLKTAPNSLPVEEGTSTLFLPPQAKTPVTGNAWGLALRYNCTIVERASDFTILKHRNDSQRPRNGQYYVSYDVAEASANIFVQYPSTRRAKNAKMILVIGSTAHYSPRVVNDLVDGGFTKDYRIGYFGNSTEAYPGLEFEDLLELQLWQHLNMTVPSNISSALPPNTLNDTIDHPISDIQPPSNYTDGYVIGLRCTSSSAVGTADIDGRYSTYTNFQRTDTALGTGAFTVYTLAVRLSWAIRQVIIGHNPNRMFDWYDSLFFSVESQPRFVAAVNDGSGVLLQKSYLQAEQFRRSILRAYATYALQLMYDGKYDFSSSSYLHPNITQALPSTVLTAGIVPPCIIVILLTIWTVGSVALGVTFGFRLRWADKLDGYSMFRFGADFAAQLTNMRDFASTVDYQECEALKTMPGLVGDSRPKYSPGHITLVRRTVAAKGKRYL